MDTKYITLNDTGWHCFWIVVPDTCSVQCSMALEKGTGRVPRLLCELFFLMIVFCRFCACEICSWPSKYQVSNNLKVIQTVNICNSDFRYAHFIYRNLFICLTTDWNDHICNFHSNIYTHMCACVFASVFMVWHADNRSV